jgi:hypothetical protein
VSVSYITARKSDDATCTRNRSTVLPPPRWNERLGIAAVFFVLGCGAGFLAGLGVL